MNALLLCAASLGALLAIVSSNTNIISDAQSRADDAEVARLMEAAPDEGSVDLKTLVDPVTGKKTEVSVIAFRD
ncbi:MAG: hypothetical protein ABL956_06435 [Hyphomonadaceae bacterium]